MGISQTTTNEKRSTNNPGCRRCCGRRLFCFGACFCLSSPKKQHKKHGDGVESVKFAKSDIPTLESIKEIKIAGAEAPPQHLHQVNNKNSDVDQDMIKEAEENNKIKQEKNINPAKVQESSSDVPIKPRYAVSLPAARLKKAKTAGDSIGEEGDGDETAVEDAGKFDSMVGASIISLTLVVMLIWGKVCAILCSAAWIFFVHCFKRTNGSFEHKNVLNHRILDLDSHEYKRTVVLKGFLERIR